MPKTYREQILSELKAMAEIGMHSPATARRVQRFLDTDEGRAEIAELEKGYCSVSDAADTLISLSNVRERSE
jgi:hypothetical protein